MWKKNSGGASKKKGASPKIPALIYVWEWKGFSITAYKPVQVANFARTNWFKVQPKSFANFYAFLRESEWIKLADDTEAREKGEKIRETLRPKSQILMDRDAEFGVQLAERKKEGELAIQKSEQALTETIYAELCQEYMSKDEPVPGNIDKLVKKEVDKQLKAQKQALASELKQMNEDYVPTEGAETDDEDLDEEDEDESEGEEDTETEEGQEETPTDEGEGEWAEDTDNPEGLADDAVVDEWADTPNVATWEEGKPPVTPTN